MKKKLVLISICIMSAVVLSACGKSGSYEKAPLQEEKTEDAQEMQNETEKETASDTKETGDGILDQEQALDSMKRISSALSNYIEVVLMNDWMYHSGSASESMDVTLNDAEKIRAAALACEADGVIDGYFVNGNGGIVPDESAQTGPYGDGYHGWTVSEKSVEEKCRDLFGTEAVWETLQTQVKNGSLDAVKYTDANGTHALLLSDEIETDTDYENQECRISPQGSGYLGELELFWGHWGKLQQDPGYSNYTVTFDLVPDENSAYKMTVSAIHIKSMDTPGENTAAVEPASPAAADPAGDSYGVFVAASKNRDDCTEVAEKLKGAGFSNCSIIYTPDFAELNPEPYYAVAAEFCASKQDAENRLAKVQAAGYKDAYIKYTGAYIGQGGFAEQQTATGGPGEAIVLNDALREKLAGHYERVFHPDGDFVCFDIDDETIPEGYRTAIRFQMSDEMAEEVMANGGEVLPNRYAFTIEINTSSGAVRITDEDPFSGWCGGRDFGSFDWNLNDE